MDGRNRESVPTCVLHGAGLDRHRFPGAGASKYQAVSALEDVGIAPSGEQLTRLFHDHNLGSQRVSRRLSRAPTMPPEMAQMRHSEHATTAADQ
jgi:hypothetical protein